MAEFFNIGPHFDNAGVNSMFALMYISVAIYLLFYVWSIWNKEGVFSDLKRMAIGFIIMSFGVSIRVGLWVPWRGFLAGGNQEYADWWRDLSWVWTWGGVILSIVGLMIVTYPALKQMFGNWALLVVLTGAGCFYAVGVSVAGYFARF